MDPGVHNITIDPRGSYRAHYEFPDDPTWDFTGLEARAEVRDRVEGEVLYISVSEVETESGYILLGPSTIDVYFSPTATATMAAVKKGAWDLFLEYANGEDVPKMFYGTVTVRKSVTDPSYD